MTRGRKPLAQEILTLRGTDRKDRARPRSAITEPVKLGELRDRCQVSGLRAATERARRIYWSVVEKVAMRQMLDEAYCSQLLFYAVEYDHFITCTESIKKEGLYLTVEGKDGKTIVLQNPAVKQRENALEKLLKIGSNFGFSPVDRQRINVNIDDPKDKKLKGIVALLYGDEDEKPDEQ